MAAIVPVLNEEKRIGEVIRRTPDEIVDELLVIDDGSTDRSADVAAASGAIVIRLGRICGVGAALRSGLRRALDDRADVAVVMAGNNKDAPEEIPSLLDPIAEDRADVVQGSRWLAEDRKLGDMPAYRRAATRLHARMFSLAARQRMTDSTNGFRAMKTSMLADKGIRLDQSWLDAYDLEPYLLLKAIRLGYRVVEVPVTKTYPPASEGAQTKMRPIVDWWSILRPLVLIGLGIRS